MRLDELERTELRSYNPNYRIILRLLRSQEKYIVKYYATISFITLSKAHKAL